MKKLSEMLNIPLTMAKFLNVGDLTKRALKERALAAGAIECVDAQVLCLEAELEMLQTDPELTMKLEPLTKILADLKAATTVEANTPTAA